MSLNGLSLSLATSWFVKSLGLFVLMAVTCDAHVLLTYPPARKYPLDFLDIWRAPPPCGMSKGLGPITDMRANEETEITWHLVLPHMGSFSINILDENEQLIHELTNGFVDTDDPTMLSYTVTVPDMYCMNCSIQIIREAKEGRSPCNDNPANKAVMFISCADVNILQQDDGAFNCSFHGTFVEGNCTCNHPWVGNKCQYKEECLEDADCLNGGKCEMGVATTYPQNHCYCSAGWFGRSCEKLSTVTTLPSNMEDYMLTADVANGDFRIYHRIMQDIGEIEVILYVKTDSWVAVGWRPTDYMSGCKLFPELLPFLNYDENAGGSCGRLPAGTSPTTGDGISAMDCLDLVVGTAKGSYSRIGDYYTRDLSTPLFDSEYGGTEDLTAAIGEESGGFTKILFRKKLQAGEGDHSDHSIVDMGMLVAWARGQVAGYVHHARITGLEDITAKPSMPDFYPTDDLKYHGSEVTRNGTTTSYGHKGFFTINFFEGARVKSDDKDDNEDSTLSTVLIVVAAVGALLMVLLIVGTVIKRQMTTPSTKAISKEPNKV